MPVWAAAISRRGRYEGRRHGLHRQWPTGESKHADIGISFARHGGGAPSRRCLLTARKAHTLRGDAIAAELQGLVETPDHRSA